MENLIYLSQHLDLSIPLFLEMYLEDDYNLVFLINDKIHVEDNLTLKERILVIKEALSMFKNLLEVAKELNIDCIEIGNPYDLESHEIWEFNEESARKFDFYTKHLGFNKNGMLFLTTVKLSNNIVCIDRDVSKLFK